MITTHDIVKRLNNLPESSYIYTITLHELEIFTDDVIDNNWRSNIEIRKIDIDECFEEFEPEETQMLTEKWLELYRANGWIIEETDLSYTFNLS